MTFQGVTRIEDMLNRLPQVAASQNANVANGSSGTATVDLRNLGVARTLVLLNGRRLPAGSPRQNGNLAADLNQIPSKLIDRVEVLTGGASATYGSDAVAGVVNFITKSDFEGISFDYQYAFYQSKNDNSILDLSRDRGFDLPPGTVTDGYTNDFSLMIGANTSDGRGNVTMYAGYREIDPVTSGQRDVNNCALQGAPGSYSCGGSSTIPTGRFADFGSLANPDCVMILDPEGSGEMVCNQVPEFDFDTGIPTGEVDDNGDLILQPEPILPWIGNSSGTGTVPWPGSIDFTTAGNTFVDRAGLLYNYQPPNYLQRPNERYTVGAMGHYEVNRSLDVYAEISYMDNQSVSQIAPSGNFGNTATIPCSNAFLSQQQFDLICTQFGFGDDAVDGSGSTATDLTPVTILRRNVEGGFRQTITRNTTHRIVIGARGEINDAWSYDVNGNFGTVAYQQTNLNDLSIVRVQRSLDAVDDGNGNIVCRSVVDGSDPFCLPWNVFEEGGVNPGDAVLDYLSTPFFATGETSTDMASGYVTGDLGEYGVKLPSADTGIQIVGGYEWRQERLRFNPDTGLQNADGTGLGGATLPVNGSFAVKEFFFEAQVPLFEGYDLAQSVNLNLGYRYSDYNTGKTTDTYKGAADWSFNDNIRIRASLQRAVRAGNLRELFQPQGLNLFDMPVDPCGAGADGAAPAATRDQCVNNTGLPSFLYGSDALNSPANQYNFLQGGNPLLDPEESDTVSFGGIFSPTFIDGLTVSLDYYNIEVEKAIDPISPAFTLDQCLALGPAEWCDQVNRDPVTGSLWLGTVGFVVGTNVNLGKLTREGVDVQVNYDFPIGSMGELNLNLVGLVLLTADIQNVPGGPVSECKGLWEGATTDCQGIFPEWSHNLRTTWLTPWDVDVSLFWRYIDAVDDRGVNGANWDSYNYIDLAATWQITDNTAFRIGVNNIFDEDPPFASDVGNAPGNGNVFPGSYDSLGRYIFAGFSLEL
jgi:outer membrane receptor protein involved in Fe transport